MALTRHIKIWNVLSKFTFEISEHMRVYVACTICTKIMQDPYVAVCGCHFCNRCISNYIGGVSRYCPGGNAECCLEALEMNINVLKDLRACHTIEKLYVNCPNELCTLTVQLGYLEEHLRVCVSKPIQCPYESVGCSSLKLGDDNQVEHIHREAFQHSQLLIDAFNNLQNDVDGLRQNVQVKDEEIKHLKEECKNNQISIKELKERIDIIMVEELKQKKSEKIFSLDLMKEIEKYKGEITDLRDATVKLQDGIKLYTRLQILNCLNDFVWIIENFSKKNGTYHSVSLKKDNYTTCLRVDINNIVEGYLDLSVIIMQGTMDDKASWPMQHAIGVTILNQNNLKTLVSKSCSYGSQRDKTVFVRPNKAVNDRIYCGRVTMNELTLDKEILQDDSILICYTLTKNS